MEAYANKLQVLAPGVGPLITLSLCKTTCLVGWYTQSSFGPKAQ